MSNLNDKLKDIVSTIPSNWKGNAEFRKANPWLREYSSQIARRILAVIEDDEDLNQTKLADLLNVKPQQISKIVQGTENLTLETIYKLSKGLGVELISFPEYKYSEKRMTNKTFTASVYQIKKISDTTKYFKGIKVIKGSYTTPVQTQYLKAS